MEPQNPAMQEGTHEPQPSAPYNDNPAAIYNAQTMAVQQPLVVQPPVPVVIQPPVPVRQVVIPQPPTPVVVLQVPPNGTGIPTQNIQKNLAKKGTTAQSKWNKKKKKNAMIIGCGVVVVIAAVFCVLFVTGFTFEPHPTKGIEISSNNYLFGTPSQQPTTSPTPVPTFAPTSNSTDDCGQIICLDCFSADSMLWIHKKGETAAVNVKLRDVEIGDSVLTVNPWSNEVFWDEVLLNIHYKWYQGAQQEVPMRTLHLDNNESNVSLSITLTDNHFVYIANMDDVEPNPTIIRSQSVQRGDMLFYYDDTKNQSILSKVIDIDDNVMSQKRVFFTSSPYVLVNNVVASPYTGSHPIYHTILHKLYINLIFLRHVIPEDLLVFLACFGYSLLLHPWSVLVTFFAICYFVIISHKAK